MSSRLYHAFVKAYQGERPPEWTDVAPLLERLLEHALACWPDVDIDEDVFGCYLAERCGLSNAVTYLGRANGAGLYLACGCARGNAHAVAAFRRALLPRMMTALVRLHEPGIVDEVGQRLLIRLLVADGDRPAAITRYDGLGELAHWLLVLTVREGYRFLRGMKRDAGRSSTTDVLGELAAIDADPEIEYLKETYRAEFKSAFQRAFASLSSADRNLFRYQYLDKLRIEQIADLYDVSRATAARWRTRARERLFQKTRDILAAELKLGSQELERAISLIGSRMEVSLTRLLRAADEDATG